MSNVKPNSTGKASPLELPRFDDSRSRASQSGQVTKLPTAEEISAIREVAREDGHKQGYEEGMKQAQAEFANLKDQFSQLMAQFELPLVQEQESVIEELAELCLLVTRQIIRRELQTNPEQVIAVVRDAIKLLPTSRRRVTIQLHPEDANLVRKIFSLDQQSQTGWQIADDPSVSRGGCLVTTDSSKIDASVEKRISDIFAHIFGDSRTVNDERDNDESEN